MAGRVYRRRWQPQDVPVPVYAAPEVRAQVFILLSQGSLRMGRDLHLAWPSLSQHTTRERRLSWYIGTSFRGEECLQPLSVPGYFGYYQTLRVHGGPYGSEVLDATVRVTPKIAKIREFSQCWYYIGRLHRGDDLPAIVSRNGNQYWFQHGLLHRKHGPAFLSPDGSEVWYREGKKYRPTCEERRAWYLRTDWRSAREDWELGCLHQLGF